MSPKGKPTTTILLNESSNKMTHHDTRIDEFINKLSSEKLLLAVCFYQRYPQLDNRQIIIEFGTLALKNVFITPIVSRFRNLY